jgi:predicted nucleotide-binding protein
MLQYDGPQGQKTITRLAFGLRLPIQRAFESGANCTFETGETLNYLREEIINTLDQNQAALAAHTIPPVRVPERVGGAQYTVTSADAMRLHTQLEALVLPEEVPEQPPPSNIPPRPQGKKVFLVHGHDVAGREIIARFLDQIGLTPVVLHEQANVGKTVIEKLEANTQASFAVVLLSPDDEGRKIGTHSLNKRARQNVILELGYFLGSLGRNRVCALYSGDIEIPSDYSGVLFVPFDAGGGWKLLLSREMKAVGIPVDMNRVV